MKDRLDGVNVGSAWVLVQRAQAGEQVPPMQGRAIDHLGWRVANLDRAIADLKARGVGFAGEPLKFEDRRIVFLQVPPGRTRRLIICPPFFTWSSVSSSAHTSALQQTRRT